MRGGFLLPQAKIETASSPSSPGQVRATRRDYRTLIAFIAVSIFWGTTAPAIRVAVRYVPPLTMASFRFFVAGLVLLVSLKPLGRLEPQFWRVHRRTFIGALALAASNAFVTLGFRHVESGPGALLLATTAIDIALLEILFSRGKKRPSLRAFAGLGLGLLGVFVLLGRPNTSALRDILGCAFLLLSSLSWSIGSVVQAKMPSRLNPFSDSAVQMLIASGLLAIVAPCIGEQIPANVPFAGWAAMLFLITTGSLIGFVAYVYVLRTLPTHVVGLYTYINPLVATLAAWWWLGEAVDLRFWVATAIVLSAVALVRQRPALDHAPSGAGNPPPAE